jgi:hypothetical protein
LFIEACAKKATGKPLDADTYQANAKKCEDRAKQMPPELSPRHGLFRVLTAQTFAVPSRFTHDIFRTHSL